MGPDIFWNWNCLFDFVIRCRLCYFQFIFPYSSSIARGSDYIMILSSVSHFNIHPLKYMSRSLIVMFRSNFFIVLLLSMTWLFALYTESPGYMQTKKIPVILHWISNSIVAINISSLFLLFRLIVNAKYVLHEKKIFWWT